MQIAIVVYPGFTALDFIGPYEVLHYLKGAEIRFVWHETGPIEADSHALFVGATHTFEETPRPDIVLVPGGLSSYQHSQDEVLLAWLRTAHQTSTWTTSVCTGSVILGSSGILEGLRATSHWGALSVLGRLGITAIGDERVVQEGKIVTSAGVSSGIDMALWLAAKIEGDEVAKAIQLALEYDPHPPFDSGHLSKVDSATKALSLKIVSREFRQAVPILPQLAGLWSLAIMKNRRRRRKALRSA